MDKTKQGKIMEFREHLQKTYSNTEHTYRGGFDELLCYELHSQPVNPRMRDKTMNNGFSTGLTFKELAKKWGISVTFLGELIADHCVKLEELGITPEEPWCAPVQQSVFSRIRNLFHLNTRQED